MPRLVTAPAVRSKVTDNRYHARTFKQQWSVDKSSARDRLTGIIQDAFHFKGDGIYGSWIGFKESTPIHVLSLPGPWWHFEKNLLRRFSDTTHLRFTCLEHARDAFRLATVRMPKADRFRSLKLGGHDVVTGGPFTLVHAPIQKFVRSARKPFRISWIDSFGPITESFLECLRNLADIQVMGGPSIVAFNLLVGRESPAVTYAMRNHKNRHDYLADFVKCYFGSEYLLGQRELYSDGKASRLQMAFVRPGSLSDFAISVEGDSNA